MPGNKDVVNQWLKNVGDKNTRQKLYQGDLAAADQSVDRGKFKHNVKASQRLAQKKGGRGAAAAGGMGFEALQAGAELQDQAFPDLQMQVVNQVEEGDLVVTHYRGTGTHKGAFYGVAPTNKQVTVEGVSIHRVQGGKIVEQWNFFDSMDLLQQLGAIPDSG